MHEVSLTSVSLCFPLSPCVRNVNTFLSTSIIQHFIGRSQRPAEREERKMSATPGRAPSTTVMRSSHKGDKSSGVRTHVTRWTWLEELSGCFVGLWVIFGGFYYILYTWFKEYDGYDSLVVIKLGFWNELSRVWLVVETVIVTFESFSTRLKQPSSKW